MVEGFPIPTGQYASDGNPDEAVHLYDDRSHMDEPSYEPGAIQRMCSRRRGEAD